MFKLILWFYFNYVYREQKLFLFSFVSLTESGMKFREWGAVGGLEEGDSRGRKERSTTRQTTPYTLLTS